MSEEEKAGSVEEGSEAEVTEQPTGDVGVENEEKGAVEEKSSEEPVKEPEKISKADYDKLSKEHDELKKLQGRQANELGELRNKANVASPKKKLTADEKLTLLATDPDKYESYLVEKAKDEALTEVRRENNLREIERELIEGYPDIKNPDTELYKETLKVMQERPYAFQSPASYILAAELASKRLIKTDDLVKKGKTEALSNVKAVSRETRMETKSPVSTGGKSKVEEMLGRTLTEKEEKFLKRLGYTPDMLVEEKTFDSVTKGGK